MEVVDKYGDLIAWFSDDLDDFNSFIDYEYRIRDLINGYNDKANAIGKPLLGFISLEMVDYLSVLLPEAVPELTKELNEIRYWSICRKNSMHPDGEGDEDEYLSEYGPRFIDARTYTKYGWSNEQCCAAGNLKWWACYYERNGLMK